MECVCFVHHHILNARNYPEHILGTLILNSFLMNEGGLVGAASYLAELDELFVFPQDRLPDLVVYWSCRCYARDDGGQQRLGHKPRAAGCS